MSRSRDHRITARLRDFRTSRCRRNPFGTSRRPGVELPFNRPQFVLTVGGPIWREDLLLAAYDGWRYKDFSTPYHDPTTRELSGDFSQSFHRGPLQPLHDRAVTGSWCGIPFPAIIPATNLAVLQSSAVVHRAAERLG